MPGMTIRDVGSRVDDSVDIEGSAQGQLAFSGTATQTVPLDEGLYDVWATTDAYIKVGATASDVTTLTGYLVRQNNTITVFVRPQSRIGSIGAGAATLSYHKVR